VTGIAGKGLGLAFTSLTTPGGDSATMSGGLTSVAGAGSDAVIIPAASDLAITLDAPLTIVHRS
jgi:hypothetical protein